MKENLCLSMSAYSVYQRFLASESSIISGSLLDLCLGQARAELLENEWLVHFDTETEGYFSVGDDEEIDAPLEWDSEKQQYKYFNFSLGWVYVDHEKLKRFRTHWEQFLKLLQQQLGIGERQAIVPLQTAGIWYLGVTWMKAYRVHCYFSCEVASREDRLSFLRAMAQEAGQVPAIILTPGDRIPEDIDLPADMAILPMDLAINRESDVFRIDQNRVVSLLKQYPRADTGNEGIGLRFSSDYRLVYWNGERYRLSKKQAALVEKLDEEGGRAHKDVLRAAAGTDLEIRYIMRRRVQGRLQPHPLWNTLILSEGEGIYVFATVKDATRDGRKRLGGT